MLMIIILPRPDRGVEIIIIKNRKNRKTVYQKTIFIKNIKVSNNNNIERYLTITDKDGQSAG